jgi:hypothetical protein
MRNVTYMLITVATMMIVWFFTSIFIAFFGEITYSQALKDPIQVIFLFLIYWWPPILVISDYEKMK